MKGWASKFILPFLSGCLILLTFSGRNYNKKPDIGRMSIDQGCSSIYFEKYDTTVLGKDLEGATFFFLPSYIRCDSIIYDEHGLALFDENGEILNRPEMNTVNNVLVGRTPLESVSYRVGFFKSDNLHTVEINLKDQNVDGISREEYSPAEICIRNPEGRVDYSSNQTLIKGRGNTTWEYEKKPYDIKLDRKVSVAGMEASDEWTFLANALDPTCLRNRLAFDTARILNMEYVTESEWIDLYIDNSYMGNYFVCHEVSQAPSGGFLLEQNATEPKKERYTFSVPSGLSITVKSPDSERITNKDINEIVSFTLRTDEAIMNHMPEAQYENIDRSSFVRRYLVDG